MQIKTKFFTGKPTDVENQMNAWFTDTGLARDQIRSVASAASADGLIVTVVYTTA